MDRSRTLVLALPEGLEITARRDTPEAVRVRVLSQRPSSGGPACSPPAFAIHRFYPRPPAALAGAGRPLRLLLSVKRFFGRVASCPRMVFTERLPALVAPCSRLTLRLRAALQEVGFATAGTGGARLASALGMRGRASTGRWSLSVVPIPQVQDVSVVGSDAGAWRRRTHDGTILVDLEKQRVIDLLPDRSVEAVQAWFEAHPDVEVVSPDPGKT